MIKIIGLIYWLILFSTNFCYANDISVLPLAQEVTLKTNQEKSIFFRIYNHSQYTQNILLNIEQWNRDNVSTNIAWSTWCFPQDKEFIINPGSFKDSYFTIRMPKNLNFGMNQKIMAMCFYTKNENDGLKQSSFHIKTRIGVAIYAKLK